MIQIEKKKVFLAGGTGYIGSRLIPLLLARGHEVVAMVRSGSERKLPPESERLAIRIGNPLEAADLRAAFATKAGGVCDTFVQLIGTPHPAPWKAASFQAVDLRAGEASVAALRASLPGTGKKDPVENPGRAENPAPSFAIRHYVYLSVAHPAPIMRAYQAVRVRCEAEIAELVTETSGGPKATPFSATCLRPWYVLGPGHRWPYAAIPVYKFLEKLPGTRAAALRLGLVDLRQMLAALVDAVERPPASGTVRILEVPEIRKFAVPAG